MDAHEHNIALSVYMEWGPEMRIPVAQRISERLPHLSSPQVAELEEWAERVHRRALVVVEPVYGEQRTREEALAQLQSEFQIISDENLSRLFNQGMYYAWHG